MANCISMMTRILHLYLSSPSLAIAGEHGKRHAMLTHKPQAVSESDWLNPHFLGTMSAFGCSENLASNSTCLIINYQDTTRSI